MRGRSLLCKRNSDQLLETKVCGGVPDASELSSLNIKPRERRAVKIWWSSKPTPQVSGVKPQTQTQIHVQEYPRRPPRQWPPAGQRSVTQRL
ncbi:hypothetical protein JHW43_000884 [Diplocarpon mali]|nr:hypothetical protein JHW43_000884 [Diplocarpon mali]